MPRSRRSPRPRSPRPERRSSSPTPTTCTCGRAPTGSSGSAACTGSWTGIGPILTDSGGFQVVSLGDLRVVDEDGVTFRSHLDGSTHRFTPEVAIAAQEALGSDIAVAFDQPVFPTSPRAVVADATDRTHRWAERSLAAHGREDQALFGIVQGGLDPELRAASTRFIASLPFDGICLGGSGRRRDAGRARRDARPGGPVARRRSATALPDGPRVAGRPARGGPPRRGPVRFGPAGARRPERPAVGAGRPTEHPQSGLPGRSGADPGRLSVPRLPAVLEGLSGPSLPRRRSCSRTVSRLVTT